jgi:hypothetical protein
MANIDVPAIGAPWWNSSDGLACGEGEDPAALVVQPISVSCHHLAPPLHRRHPAVGAFGGVEAVRQRSLCKITRDVADGTTPITKAASPAMRRASVSQPWPARWRSSRRRAVRLTGRETPHRRCGLSAGDRAPRARRWRAARRAVWRSSSSPAGAPTICDRSRLRPNALRAPPTAAQRLGRHCQTNFSGCLRLW